MHVWLAHVHGIGPCSRDLPDASTLRKHYIEKHYDKTICKIKNKLSDNYIWVSADETIEIKGRCVVNVIAGILHPDIPYEPFLISTQFRSSVNAEEIAQIVKQAVVNIINADVSKILLFVSDAAATMLKVGQLLKEAFPNVLHLTCFAHAIHRICEVIWEEFPDVNKLISSCKNFVGSSIYGNVI